MGLSKLNQNFVGALLGLSFSMLCWAQAPAPSTPPSLAGAAAVLPANTPAADSRIYIAVGDPNVKKVLMAIETSGSDAISREFSQTLINDMDYTDLFELLPSAKMPEKKGSLEAYKVLGVEFLLQGSIVSQSDNKVEAELRLFDVARGLQIFGRRYPLVAKTAQPGRELAHFGGNDVIQALTGEAGIFRTRLLMSCGQRIKEIYIMDFDGQNVRRITRDGNFALSPNWAPDGKRIVFTSYKPARSGGPLNPNLYMFDTFTNQRKILSAAVGLNTGAAFHPTQEKLAYTFSQNGRPEIYTLDLLANTRTPVTKTHFFSVEPSWSPDGLRLVYSSKEVGRPHIFVANADGSSRKRLTIAGEYNSSPNWSPKGDKIIFSGQENQGNNYNIFMIDPSGSNLVRLTDGIHSSENPVFSPDARFIAFSSNLGGAYRINVMTARGTRIRQLSPPSIGPCKQPAWSPRL